MSSRWERQSGEPGCLVTRARGIHYDEGGTVPAAGTVGYAPGAIFLLTVTPPRNGNLYINNGTYASSLFQLFISGGGVAPVLLSGLTLTVTAALHAGRTVLCPAQSTITLPSATGTGNRYRFVVNVISTALVINCTSSDVYLGSIASSKPASTWATANIGETFASTANQTITLNGTATGGATIGDFVEIEDIAAAKFQVFGWTTNTTTPTTPFS